MKAETVEQKNGLFEAAIRGALARCREWCVAPWSLSYDSNCVKVVLDAGTVNEEAIRCLCTIYGPPVAADLWGLAWTAMPQIREAWWAHARSQDEFDQWMAMVQEYGPPTKARRLPRSGVAVDSEDE
jgi:hypothetical protein